MGGDKPIGLVIGLIALAATASLAAAIVPAFYLFANVYAIVTGTDFSSDTMNVGVFLTGLVLVVATLLVGMAVAVSLVGRALAPKRRRGLEGDQGDFV